MAASRNTTRESPEPVLEAIPSRSPFSVSTNVRGAKLIHKNKVGFK